MKKLFFFSMLFLASIVTHAQTTYGGPTGNSAGQNGGNQSSFFGTSAGLNSMENKSTFIGYRAGMNSKSSQVGKNTFVGWNSGENNNTGRENTFIGAAAGVNNVNGYWNVFVGASAGQSNAGGVAHSNTYVGYQAGLSNVTGTLNVSLGNQAGRDNTGSRNVFIGNRAGANETTGSNRLYIDNSDTDTPLIYGDFSANDLTLNAGVSIVAPDGNTELDLKSTGNNSGWHNQIRFHDNTNLRHVIADNFTDGRLVISPGFGGNAANVMQVNGSLLVGNGAFSNTPSGYKLYVTEGILTEKVKVAAYGSIDWADYVFEDNYDLNSPEEVEQFVKEHKHLPNVPSAKEVNENGVDMVEMDATLLRQIEELWLHVIDLKKEIQQLETELEQK